MLGEDVVVVLVLVLVVLLKFECVFTHGHGDFGLEDDWFVAVVD